MIQKLLFSFILWGQKILFGFRDKTFKSSTGNIYYLENKNLGKPVLVLVHGFSDIPDSLMLSTIYIQKHFHIILPALKGFDKEGVTEGDSFSLDKYADQILELIDSYQAKSFVIGGNSLGGAVATMVYKKSNVEVKKLILMDSAGFEFDGVETITSKVKEGSRNPFLIDNAIEFDFFIKQLFHRTPRGLSAVKKLFLKKYISQRYAYEYLAQEFFKESSEKQFILEPEKVSLPTLVVWGEFDKFFPVEVAKRIHEATTNSTLNIIRNSGHVPHIEKPLALAKALKDFLILS